MGFFARSATCNKGCVCLGGLEGGWGDERSADKLVSCLGGFLISAPPGPLLPFRSVFHLLLTSSYSDRNSKKNVLITREKN